LALASFISHVLSRAFRIIDHKRHKADWIRTRFERDSPDSFHPPLEEVTGSSRGRRCSGSWDRRDPYL